MAMDVSQLHAKERKHARKNLLKKIDSYNKELRKARRPSFPLTNPSKQDLKFKGVLKVTFDRGYAVQTKSILLDSTTTAGDVVEQLFDSIGLRGALSDYALEEHNAMTGESRYLGSTELPLSLQLNYGPHSSYVEVRLVQVRDTHALPNLSRGVLEEEDGPAVNPKEEVIDYGIASIELVMEEALQDIPPLVYDIQERLKVLSETVTVDGKPRPGLPNRRLLWDILKPRASALVKDIRRLVDNGEFLASRHCSSPVFKLIVTLLLELITDYSRELVTVTKEMCGLKGAARKDFLSSVSSFVHKVIHISKLVGKVNDSLRAMALSGHLLEATSPENFQNGKLQSESYFSGSKSASGVLLFTIVTAYLGLVRASYEEKKEYFSPLATNMLRSVEMTMETVQKTDEYTRLHLHPLRSRVRDMEHKLKVAMDNLVRETRVASSPRPPPGATPDLLLSGHVVIMASLDFLVVAQCASLLHKVAITGWNLMQFPWVRAIAEGDSDDKSDTVGAASSVSRLSSLGSDSASSTADSASYYSPHRSDRERKSRIPTNQRESGDGMDATELAASKEDRMGDSVRKLGIRSLRIKVPYYRGDIRPTFEDSSGDEADDEATRTRPTPASLSSPTTPLVMSDTDLDRGSDSAADHESQRSREVRAKKHSSSGWEGGFHFQGSESMGIDAVKKLRMHYNVNKAIAKCSESLLLTITRKMASLSTLCRDGMRDKYSPVVELIVAAARQIREEVAIIEDDLATKNMADSLKRTQAQMEAAEREVHIATLMASSSVAPESSAMKLMSAVEQLKEICSRTVRDTLAMASEYKKSLEQAEKIEQEFITLMTGQSQSHKQKATNSKGQKQVRRNYSSPARLSMQPSDAEEAGLAFEESSFGGGGRSWGSKDSPRVIGGSVQQLFHRLTFHRTIDPEFSEVFLLTFHMFMTSEEFVDALTARFNIPAPEDLSDWEEEAFEVDIALPVRLRVVQALKAWLHSSYGDFKNQVVARKTEALIKAISVTMPSCAKQFSELLTVNQHQNPSHFQPKARGNPPAPLIPMGLSQGSTFDLLDVNTLELARQLTLAYSGIFRAIQPQELTCLGWLDESKHHLVPNILCFLQMSKNLSELVCKEVLQESMEDDQASVISYFIHTAKSCLELKNFEALFAIMDALESPSVQRAETSWQMLNEHLVMVYDELQEMVSPEINYHRYRQELRIIHQAPVVPNMRLFLVGLEEVDKDYRDYLPRAAQGMVNFQKCRQFARVVQQVRKYQSTSYNLYPVEVMQRYLSNLCKKLTEEELEQLSSKVEEIDIQT